MKWWCTNAVVCWWVDSVVVLLLMWWCCCCDNIAVPPAVASTPAGWCRGRSPDVDYFVFCYYCNVSQSSTHFCL
jgi:hypothetical protein